MDTELQGGGRWAGFLPHSSFIVPPVRGGRRMWQSWPSFLKCQAPLGGCATSGLAPPLQLTSWVNNDSTCAGLQPSVASRPAVESSNKNSASQLIGTQQAVSRGQVSRGKAGPLFLPSPKSASNFTSHWEHASKPTQKVQTQQHLPTGPGQVVNMTSQSSYFSV